MSYDLGVWYSDHAMSREEAGNFYGHIGSDWVIVRRHPSFRAFLAELLARYPGPRGYEAPPSRSDEPAPSLLSTWADLKARRPSPEQIEAAHRAAAAPEREDSPWNSWPLWPNGSTLTFSLRSKGRREIESDVRALALSHGLIFYNPQSGKVWLPRELSTAEHRPDPKPVLVLTISGREPALSAEMSLAGEPMVREAVFSRRDAHAKARALALSNALADHRVVDAGRLARAMTFKPVSPTDPDVPGPFKRILGAGFDVRRLVVPDA